MNGQIHQDIEHNEVAVAMDEWNAVYQKKIDNHANKWNGVVQNPLYFHFTLEILISSMTVQYKEHDKIECGQNQAKFENKAEPFPTNTAFVFSARFFSMRLLSSASSPRLNTIFLPRVKQGHKTEQKAKEITCKSQVLKLLYHIIKVYFDFFICYYHENDLSCLQTKQQ